jgi:hypothetical protein
VCQFLRWQRGFPIPSSSSAFGKIGDRYVQEVGGHGVSTNPKPPAALR